MSQGTGNPFSCVWMEVDWESASELFSCSSEPESRQVQAAGLGGLAVQAAVGIHMPFQAFIETIQCYKYLKMCEKVQWCCILLGHTVGEINLQEVAVLASYLVALALGILPLGELSACVSAALEP